MECPYCGGPMIPQPNLFKEIQTNTWSCDGSNPRLLNDEKGTCPYEGDVMTQDEITSLEVSLIDLDC